MKSPLKVARRFVLITRAGLTAFVVYCCCIRSALGQGAGSVPAKYMGTATCSSSNCHGSSAARSGSNVLQNEYVIWLRHDEHAKSWKVLSNADSKRIGKHLGIDNPAESETCLACHSTHVPAAQRGEKFQTEDGVSCESCHGAAEHWLAAHAKAGADRNSSIEKGMRDLFPLTSRASLCLGCHLGDDKRKITHRLFGAGHPRLSFELDTFSAIQPRHWEVDDDYKKRKGSYSPVRAWLVGQVIRSVEMLTTLGSKERSRDGIMPELSLFYCYSCHHSLSEEQWKGRNYEGRPGKLRLNLSSLQILKKSLEVLEDPVSAEFQKNLDNLHDAYQQGNAEPLLRELRETLTSRVMPRIERIELTDSQKQKLLRHLVSVAAEAGTYQYEDAEQLAMAMSSITEELTARRKAYKPALDAIYNALDEPHSFVPDKFASAAKDFLKLL